MPTNLIDRFAHLFVRLALIALAAAGIATSAISVTVIADELAATYPEYPRLRPEYTVGVVIVLIAGLTVVVSIWRLLDQVKRATIFMPSALRYTTTIISALSVAGLVCITLSVVTLLETGQQNPGTGLGLLAVTGGAWAAAALTWVLRRLLEEAASMKHELSEVV